MALATYYLLIVGHRTPFDYFGRLAQALWQGRYWLDGAPLSELAQGRGGHFYNEQPPGPVPLLMLLVPFGSSAQIEVFLSASLGALCVVPQFLALRALGVPRALAATCGLLVVFGTGLLFTATDGRSWFDANVTGTFFATVALWLAATKRSPFLIGLALGMGALARTPIGLAGPGLLLLARRDETSLREIPRAFALFTLGVLPFALTQVIYDIARWGDPFLIYGPQVRDNTIGTFSRGPNSISYIPRQLYAMFFLPPAFADVGPFFLRPQGAGMAILMGSPALLWVARGLRQVRSAPAWGAIAIATASVMAPEMLLPVTGAEQYGYRYSLDYQPFLIVLTAVGAGWTGSVWGRTSGLFGAAVVLSVAATFYFFFAIRIAGFSY